VFLGRHPDCVRTVPWGPRIFWVFADAHAFAVVMLIRRRRRRTSHFLRLRTNKTVEAEQRAKLLPKSFSAEVDRVVTRFAGDPYAELFNFFEVHSSWRSLSAPGPRHGRGRGDGIGMTNDETPHHLNPHTTILTSFASPLPALFPHPKFAENLKQ
jgi:hypothetical protein